MSESASGYGTNIAEAVTSKWSIAIAGIGLAGATMYAVSRLEVDSIRDATIPTEQAVSAFSLLTGIGGAAAQILASKRLSSAEGSSITVGSIALPIVISAAISAGSPLLIRTG